MPNTHIIAVLLWLAGAVLAVALMAASFLFTDAPRLILWGCFFGGIALYGIWTIATAKREKPNGGPLRLPKLALDVINAQPHLAANPFVFAGATRGRPFGNFSQAKADLQAKLPKDMPQWGLHDLRRTARSLMSRAGVRPDISERVLGHAIGGVEGVYDRHDYAEEKAAALLALATLVETILHPPACNVVSLPKRSAR
jgi:integrase